MFSKLPGEKLSGICKSIEGRLHPRIIKEQISYFDIECDSLIGSWRTVCRYYSWTKDSAIKQFTKEAMNWLKNVK